MRGKNKKLKRCELVEYEKFYLIKVSSKTPFVKIPVKQMP